LSLRPIKAMPSQKSGRRGRLRSNSTLMPASLIAEPGNLETQRGTSLPLGFRIAPPAWLEAVRFLTLVAHKGSSTASRGAGSACAHFESSNLSFENANSRFWRSLPVPYRSPGRGPDRCRGRTETSSRNRRASCSRRAHRRQAPRPMHPNKPASSAVARRPRPPLRMKRKAPLRNKAGCDERCQAMNSSFG